MEIVALGEFGLDAELAGGASEALSRIEPLLAQHLANLDNRLSQAQKALYDCNIYHLHRQPACEKDSLSVGHVKDIEMSLACDSAALHNTFQQPAQGSATQQKTTTPPRAFTSAEDELNSEVRSPRPRSGSLSGFSSASVGSAYSPGAHPAAPVGVSTQSTLSDATCVHSSLGSDVANSRSDRSAHSKPPSLSRMDRDALLASLHSDHAAVLRDWQALRAQVAALYETAGQGKRLRAGDEGFRKLVREVAGMPAFLGLVLFQRMVEAALVRDARLALLVQQVEEKMKEAVQAQQEAVAALEAAAGCARTVSTAGASSSIPPLPLSPSPTHSMCSMDLGTDASSSTGTVWLAGRTASVGICRDTLILSAVQGRLTVPTSAQDAAVRRVHDRIRASLRQRLLARSISYVDWISVWPKEGNSVLSGRAGRMLLLCTASPDPVLVSECLDNRATVKAALKLLNKKGAARVAALATLVSPAMSPSTTGFLPHTSSSKGLTAALAAQEVLDRATARPGLGSGQDAVSTAFAVVYEGWVRLAERLQSQAPMPQSAPFSYPSVAACKERGPLTVVTQADIAPVLESLVERHPDLANVRGGPHALVRQRYVSYTTAMLFSQASRMGPCNLGSLTSQELLDSAIADAIYATATTSVISAAPFASRSFEQLHAVYCNALLEDKRESERVKAGYMARAKALQALQQESVQPTLSTAKSAVRTMLRRLNPFGAPDTPNPPLPQPAVSASAPSTTTAQAGKGKAKAPNLGLTVTTATPAAELERSPSPDGSPPPGSPAPHSCVVTGSQPLPLTSPATVAAVKNRRRSLQMQDEKQDTKRQAFDFAEPFDSSPLPTADATPSVVLPTHRQGSRVRAVLPLPTLPDPDTAADDSQTIGYTALRTFLCTALGPASSVSGMAGSDVGGSGINPLLLWRALQGAPRPLMSGYTGRMT